MMHFVDGLERGERKQAGVYFQREMALLFLGIALLIVLSAVLDRGSSTADIRKALAVICSGCLLGAGGVFVVLRARALRSAEQWKGVADAFRVPGITQAQVNKLTVIVFQLLKREIKNGDWPGSLSGLFRSQRA